MKIITQTIYRNKSNNPQLVQELTNTQKELAQIKKDKKEADSVLIKIAKKLNISENDPDHTYQGIYKVWEESLEGWQKPKPKKTQRK